MRKICYICFLILPLYGVTTRGIKKVPQPPPVRDCYATYKIKKSLKIEIPLMVHGEYKFLTEGKSHKNYLCHVKEISSNLHDITLLQDKHEADHIAYWYSVYKSDKQPAFVVFRCVKIRIKSEDVKKHLDQAYAIWQDDQLCMEDL